MWCGGRMIPLPLETLYQTFLKVLQSPSFQYVLHAWQAHKIDLFTIGKSVILSLYFRWILLISFYRCNKLYFFAVLLLPSAQSLPWEFVKLCVDTIIPFVNGVVERSTKMLLWTDGSQAEKKMSEDLVEMQHSFYFHMLCTVRSLFWPTNMIYRHHIFCNSIV